MTSQEDFIARVLRDCQSRDRIRCYCCGRKYLAGREYHDCFKQAGGKEGEKYIEGLIRTPYRLLPEDVKIEALCRVLHMLTEKEGIDLSGPISQAQKKWFERFFLS